MSLACIVCHGTGNSSESFRSYSSSDSENDTSCIARGKCWMKKASGVTGNVIMNSKVAPQPVVTPRLLRCPALRRDIFRDWHFEEVSRGGQRVH